MMVLERRRRTMRPIMLGDLDAVLYYNTMPDAQTQAIIAARGDTIELQTPAQTYAAQPAELDTPYEQQVIGQTYNIGPYSQAPSWADYWNQSTPGYEFCQPLDAACVARVTAALDAAIARFEAAGGDRNASVADWNAAMAANQPLATAFNLPTARPAAPATAAAPAQNPPAAASPQPAAASTAAAPLATAAADTLNKPAGTVLPPSIAALIPAKLVALPMYVWILAAGAVWFLFLRGRR